MLQDLHTETYKASKMITPEVLDRPGSSCRKSGQSKEAQTCHTRICFKFDTMSLENTIHWNEGRSGIICKFSNQKCNMSRILLIKTKLWATNTDRLPSSLTHGCLIGKWQSIYPLTCADTGANARRKESLYCLKKDIYSLTLDLWRMLLSWGLYMSHNAYSLWKTQISLSVARQQGCLSYVKIEHVSAKKVKINLRQIC